MNKLPFSTSIGGKECDVEFVMWRHRLAYEINSENCSWATIPYGICELRQLLGNKYSLSVLCENGLMQSQSIWLLSKRRSLRLQFVNRFDVFLHFNTYRQFNVKPTTWYGIPTLLEHGQCLHWSSNLISYLNSETSIQNKHGINFSCYI